MMNKKDEMLLWGSLASSIFFGFFTIKGIIYELFPLIEQIADDKAPPKAILDPLIGLIILGGITFFSVRLLYRISAQYAEAEKHDEEIKNPLKKLKPKGDLAKWNKEQWERVLPKKPGNTSWPVSYLDAVQAMDKALNEFYEGGSSSAVENQLIRANVLIDALTEHAYNEDQRPGFRKICTDIQNILNLIKKPHYSDPRLDLLNADSDDIMHFEHSGTGNLADYLADKFRDDPRVFNIWESSGYWYTTGESDGNSSEYSDEDLVSVFKMSYHKKNHADIHSTYKRASTPEKYLTTICLNQSGYGLSNDQIELGDIFLRYGDSIFDIKSDTGKLYDGPEGTDDNYTKDSDIHYTHSLEFTFDNRYAEGLIEEVEAMIKDANPQISMTVK